MSGHISSVGSRCLFIFSKFKIPPLYTTQLLRHLLLALIRIPTYFVRFPLLHHVLENFEVIISNLVLTFAFLFCYST